jgi:Abi-like protein
MKTQNFNYDKLMPVFSEERLDGYLSHFRCVNKNSALKAYSRNIKLSQALYPSLQILEVSLRNMIHQAISVDNMTEHWFDLNILHHRERIRVNAAKNNLGAKNKALQPGRIVAELSFGFWTSLFDKRYEHDQVLWPRLISQVFQCIPKCKRTRKYLSKELNIIRNLRNRIFHYEPIWHWQDLTGQHFSIVNMISWLSPEAAEYLSSVDEFIEVYSCFKKRTSL